MYVENEPAMKKNDLPGELYKKETNEKFQIIANIHW